MNLSRINALLLAGMLAVPALAAKAQAPNPAVPAASGTDLAYGAYQRGHFITAFN